MNHKIDPSAPLSLAGLGLVPVINASGTMTALGSCRVLPEVAAAAQLILPEFVPLADLQRAASRAIAEATGAEAGLVTASTAAGITLAVAAMISGDDLAAIERLPEPGAPHQVVMLAGHMVNYGAPVDQAMRLAGVEVVPVGQATGASVYQLEGALTPNTVAAVYVVSHHVVDYGQIPLPVFAQICHARGIKVIVDAASEYDLRGFLAAGADVALYSGHKFLGGLTAGICAGNKALIRSMYLQNRGIGRGMKVGKEAIIGTIAALQAWAQRDHEAIRKVERAALELWHAALQGQKGVRAEIVPDPTGNPLERLTVSIDPAQARITAWDLADQLAAGDPAIIVRDDEIDRGAFQLDPCNLKPGEAEQVADRLAAALEEAQNAPAPLLTSLDQRWRDRDAAILSWPD